MVDTNFFFDNTNQAADPALIPQDPQKVSDLQFQLSFIQRMDPTIIKILFASTFTAAYEVSKPLDGSTGVQRELDIEGTLYFL